MVMKLLVVDDHEIARDGLKLQLVQISGSCEVFEAGTCAQAIQTCRDNRFDLVLLDLTLPDSTGLETLRRFRQSAPHNPVVVLSAVTGREVVMAAIEEGAMGFIPKAASRSEIVTALEMILAGGIYVPPDSLAGPSTFPPGQSADASEVARRLTERQLEVLRAAIRGKPNKVIADELELSVHTVKAHLSAAMRVLGVTNRTEAVFRAARLGLPLSN
jgi:DNA-binding NarL/FixJ family response regulator